ncbi:MAG: NfeD family protein [Treponema sp.]|nr:NfeD family protein [Treponema sp.]
MSLFILNNLMWFWLAVMIVCLIVEAFTFSLTSIWGAISALVLIFLSKIRLPFKWQLIIFLVLTIVLVLTTRPFAVKKLKLGKEKTNVDSLVGQKVLVVKDVTAFEKGEVKTKGGVIWSAKSDSSSEEKIKKGSTCEILSVEGNTLIIKGVE